MSSGAKNMFIILILNHINAYHDFQYQISKIVLAIFKLKLELKQKVWLMVKATQVRLKRIEI